MEEPLHLPARHLRVDRLGARDRFRARMQVWGAEERCNAERIWRRRRAAQGGEGAARALTRSLWRRTLRTAPEIAAIAPSHHPQARRTSAA